MKNAALLIRILIGISSFAQENTNETAKRKPSFTCEAVTFDSDKNTIELEGNVSFKTDIIELENADRVLYNQTTNELVVTGAQGFTFDGTIQITDQAKKKILRYTLGERIAYLE